MPLVARNSLVGRAPLTRREVGEDLALGGAVRLVPFPARAFTFIKKSQKNFLKTFTFTKTLPKNSQKLSKKNFHFLKTFTFEKLSLSKNFKKITKVFAKFWGKIVSASLALQPNPLYFSFHFNTDNDEDYTQSTKLIEERQ